MGKHTLLEKGFKKGSFAVPIGEPFLVSGRTLFGSRYNYVGFHVEPSVMGSTWNQKGFFKGLSYGILDCTTHLYCTYNI
jgi:hypothetical protein